MYFTNCRKSKLISVHSCFRSLSLSRILTTKSCGHTTFFSQYSSHSTAVNTNIPKKDVSGKLPRHYESSKVESGWYQWWEQEAFFQLPRESDGDRNTKPFTMILPPPNVTGTLHLGHALTVTVQDVIARWRRMCGHNVLWIPGTDHAGIATQVVVEKQLWAKERATRHKLGRKNFVNEIWKWQEDKGSHIQNQLRLMGASLDWTREYFTMDENQSLAVVEAFVRLFEEGLIYRSDIPVNWSCWLQSTISDVEIESHEINGPTTLQVPGYDKPIQFGTLTNIVYKSCENNSDIIVSTTRPETMLGDVAIAVHPADSRYAHLHGSYFWHPYRKQKIPLICDDFVDQDFGTGAVKITPAHDKNDFEVARRHELPLISVINERGEIQDNFEVFKGMKRFDARESIVKDLALLGLLQGESPHKMVIPICSRSGDIVELIPKSQWFLSTGDMAKNAIKAVQDGHLWLTPEQSEQRWIRWFENHQDWCLSRQLWWGHRIPMFKCFVSDESSHKWVAARTEEEAKLKASSYFSCQPNDAKLSVQQDKDVLDTWFSSSLLPFTALGWPSKTKDLKKLYPLSLMVTGNDILLFWVARMVILGKHLTGMFPFSDVFLHGVIRDGSGKKMSKSVGNVVSPEDIRDGRSLKELVDRVVSSSRSGVIPEKELKNAIRNQQNMFPNGIPQCGTDALRFTLCSYQIERHFIDFNVLDCDGARRFCNKIWQACRYVEGVMEHSDIPGLLQPGDSESLCVMDLWILSKLSNLIAKIDEDLNKFNLNDCVHGLRNFIHHEFCDVYVESTKFLRTKEDAVVKDLTRRVLATCVQNALVLLAPFMPFMTEELYHRIPYIQRKCNSITIYPYPQPKDWLYWQNTPLEREIDFILKTASAIKKLKNYNGLKVMDRVQVKLSTKSAEELQYFLKHTSLLETLSYSKIVDILESMDNITSDFMTEEKINDSCLLKIVFENEKDEVVSENHRQGVVTSAFMKHLKLQDKILKIKKKLASQKFILKDDDIKQTLQEKLANLEEEHMKVDLFLNQAPSLRDKIKEEMAQKKSAKR